MPKTQYNLFLDGQIIGTTELEKADPPMGVVYGQVQFIGIVSGYDFFKKYCAANNIALTADFPDDKLLSTRTIKGLSVRNERGVEIQSLGNQISGMDSDSFDITLEGVAYPIYEEEFPHHVQAYNNQYKASTHS